MNAHSISPNVFTYTSLIKCCGNAHKPNLALLAFSQMQKVGVPPNIRTLTALVTACAKSNKWEKAVGFVQNAEEWMIAPNVFTYSAAIDGCRRCGKWDVSMTLLATMCKHRETRPNEITYNMVLAACSAGGNREAALATFAAMRSEGFSPVSYTKGQLQPLFAGTPLEGDIAELELLQTGSGDSRHVPDIDPVTAEKSVME